MTEYKNLYYISTKDGYDFLTDADDKITFEQDLSAILSLNGFKPINAEFFGYTDLAQFKQTYQRWEEEINLFECKNHKNKTFHINLRKYININTAIIFLVGEFSGIKNLKNLLPQVDEEEYKIFKRCNNGGLITYDKEQANKPFKAYAYDFKSQYPNLLQNLALPKNKGTKQILKQINFNKIQYGIYRIRITYENKDFEKVFSFSKYHHYTHKQIKDLYSHKDIFGLSFELLDADDDYDYNAYVYEADYLKLEDVFKRYNSQLQEMRKLNKDNKLIKMLLSSSWGCFTQTNKIKVDMDSDDYLNLAGDDDYIFLGPELGTNNVAFIKTDNIAKYNGFYRIKPFLTSNCRQFMLNYAVKNDLIKNIMRIHTDCFMLNEKKTFNEKLNKGVIPILEDKNSGLMIVKNGQDVERVN